MDDWLAPAPRAARASPRRRGACGRAAAEPAAVAELAGLLERAARRPALVVGAGADDARGLGGARRARRAARLPGLAGGVRRAGGLPAGPPAVRRAPARRRAARLRDDARRPRPGARRGRAGLPPVPVRAGPAGRAAARASALVTDDPAEAHRSPVDLACSADARRRLRARSRERSPARDGPARRRCERPPPPAPPADGEPLRAGHVLAALAERLPADAVLVEEAPSNRPELHARIPARAPLGFLSAAMGGLGFALPARDRRCAWRCPTGPVVAVVGDGSSLYHDPGAVERRALRRRACSSWSSPTAATRHGPARRDAGRARAVAGVRRDRHRRDGARAGLPGAARRATTPSCWRRSTRCSPGSATARAAAARGRRRAGQEFVV